MEVLILKVVTGVIIGRSAQVLILNDLVLGAERVAVEIEGWILVQRSAPVAAWEQFGEGVRGGQEARDKGTTPSHRAFPPGAFANSPLATLSDLFHLSTTRPLSPPP